MIIDANPDRPSSPSPSEVLPSYANSQSNIALPPPAYNPIPRPPHPVTYQFHDAAAPVPGPSSAMHLVDQAQTSQEGVETQPLFYVEMKLSLHPFTPLGYVTTVRREGGNGQFVGSFEMSLHGSRAILTIGDAATRLSNVFWRIPGVKEGYGWRVGNVKLMWDCNAVLDDGSPMLVCYTAPSSSQTHAAPSQQLASFVPPPPDASPPRPAASLTVFPDGYEHFEHILLSALILERKRSLILPAAGAQHQHNNHPHHRGGVNGHGGRGVGRGRNDGVSQEEMGDMYRLNSPGSSSTGSFFDLPPSGRGQRSRGPVTRTGPPPGRFHRGGYHDSGS